MSRRVDLSVLRPFTDGQMEHYMTFLRENGSDDVAEAVAVALGHEDDVPDRGDIALAERQRN